MMNSLGVPEVAAEITRLHEQAELDPQRWSARPPEGENSLIRMKEMYLAVSPDEGRLLYSLVRACQGGSCVEFGSSYGISTLYIAAALRDKGQGHLYSTEIHPDKCAAARQSLERAGLSAFAEIIEGDARETLRHFPHQVDFLFLDGWKSLYIPVLELLLPRLNPGALVLADNINHDAARDFAAYIRSSDKFLCHDLGKQELCCYTG